MVQEHTFKIAGMGCQDCVEKVKAALQNVPGVVKSDVSVGEAKVTMEDGASTDGVLKAISGAGFNASPEAIKQGLLGKLGLK